MMLAEKESVGRSALESSHMRDFTEGGATFQAALSQKARLEEAIGYGRAVGVST